MHLLAERLRWRTRDGIWLVAVVALIAAVIVLQLSAA